MCSGYLKMVGDNEAALTRLDKIIRRDANKAEVDVGTRTTLDVVEEVIQWDARVFVEKKQGKLESDVHTSTIKCDVGVFVTHLNHKKISIPCRSVEKVMINFNFF